MTGFGSLVRANNALGAASYGLDVTGQNISNANTTGYTRQRADQVSVGPVSNVPSMYVSRQRGDQGVAISGTSRLNDPVIDARDRLENSRSSYLATAASTASAIETAFPEPTTSGLSSQLDTYFQSWAALANQPNASGTASTALRQAVLSAGTAVTTSLNTASQNLADTASTLSSQLSSTVTAAQNSATQLGQLNAAIKVASSTGQNTNALADQRDMILADLAKSVGGTATINSDGTADVTVGGQALVTGNTVSTLAIDPTSQVTVNGTVATMTTGAAGALVTGITVTVPAYQAKLDNVAATLASTVNAAHQAGYDANGLPGGAFFSGTTAATISVAITNPSDLAASGSASASGNNDGTQATLIANLATAPGSASTTYVNLVGDVGSMSALAAQQQTIQDSVTSNIDATRQSNSGVNYDEEVTNLLMYQRSYQAASRVLTTVDDMLDTLINRTGKVGL
ncbi:flagellar hook-associated protein 1 FlgK [Frankineae bacterium MT45]|nr:flagellar hook-associated protein 1 FlgK [Frankineae bacterium MT45]